MDIINLSNLQEGKTYIGFIYLKSINIRTTKNNSQYIEITLTDGKSDITGRYFDVEKNEGIEWFKNIKDKFVCIEISIEKYNGQTNAKIIRFFWNAEKPENISDTFIHKSMDDSKAEEYIVKLKNLISQIKDEEIKKICSYIFLEKYYNIFIVFPASKSNHHSGKYGLLEHSINIALEALAIKKIYEYIYELDEDLLIAGALLQDIGKIEEYLIDEYYFAEKTELYALKGHITRSNEIFIEAAIALDIDYKSPKLQVLSNIILSHHGKLEYGSPTLPASPEAILIAKLDNLDASLKGAIETIKKMPESEKFTKSLSHLDNCILLNPNLYRGFNSKPDSNNVLF